MANVVLPGMGGGAEKGTEKAEVEEDEDEDADGDFDEQEKVGDEE